MTNNYTLPLIFISLLFATFFLGKCSSSHSDKLVDYDKKFKVYQDSIVIPLLKQSDSLKKVISASISSSDSIKKISDGKTSQINKIKVSVTTLDLKNRKLIDSLSNIAPVVCQPIITAIDNSYRSEVDSLKKEISLSDERHVQDSIRYELISHALTISVKNSDSLRYIIKNFPTPPKSNNKLLGFIPKPSGLLVGFLGGIALTVGSEEAIRRIAGK